MTLVHVLGFLSGAGVAAVFIVYAFYVREKRPTQYKGLFRFVAAPGRTPWNAIRYLLILALGWLIGGAIIYFVFLSHAFPQVFFIDMLLVIVLALAVSVCVLVVRRADH